MVISMMKRFDIQFRNETPDGLREVTVSTDDLDSLASAVWFREFIGLKDVVKVQDLGRQVSELRLALEEERVRRQRAEMQSMQMQMQPAPQMIPPIPPPPVAQKAQSQAPPSQKLSRPGFLDVSPDAMTEAMWKTLSSEQQAQWFERWGINQ